MGWLNNRIDRSDLQPGDHIYSWRGAYVYAHHGIYMGDGNVIHFTVDGGEIRTGIPLDWSKSVSSSSSLQSSSDVPCDKCLVPSTLHGVLCSCLDCFLRGGELRLYGYSVSRLFHKTHRGGTCNRTVSDPENEVCRRANYHLEHGFGNYNVLKNNCEDFAMYCKTGQRPGSGLGQSGQVASAVGAATTTLAVVVVVAIGAAARMIANQSRGRARCSPRRKPRRIDDGHEDSDPDD